MKSSGCQNWLYLAFILLNFLTASLAEKQKRQIFREQVLPSLGGKIPEDAFRTDRLALNRLNKEGISVPDGVILDARHVHKHPHSYHGMADVIKVYLTPDGRYVPPEGRYHYNHPKSVDTTYLIRKPFSQTAHHKYSNSYAPHKQRGYSKPRQPTYTNYRQYVPILPPPKAGVYKPIVTPLVIPGNSDLLEDAYLPSWNVGYDWDAVYQPFDDYFANNIALFNSHQIISDYQGFLNEYHERSSRHIGGKSSDRNQAHQNGKSSRKIVQTGQNPLIPPRQNAGPDVTDTQHPLYPNLSKIPETKFSCHGRKGMFADVETKCQVFHSCSGWSRTSSLCPPGTAYSEAKNRCEWWNTVACK